MRLRAFDVPDQRASLHELAKLVESSIPNPRVRQAALLITADCPARDDMAELTAIFNAVKSGDSRVAGLENGVRYVADPKILDFFTAPPRLLEQCARGACAEDCDGQAALVASLAGSLGFEVGLRAYAPEGTARGQYTHVYAVANVPKRAPRETIGLDTTVPDSNVGWQPPSGIVLTAWVR